MATEIGLPWTYVGGPVGLVERILGEALIEALPGRTGDPLTRIEDWVADRAVAATGEVMAAGETVIATSRGTVTARLDRTGLRRRPLLWTSCAGTTGSAAAWRGR